MKNNVIQMPTMAQIAEDAKNLSHFNDGGNHTFRSIIQNEADEEDYDGFDDDDLSFDGRKKSFEDQHLGQRMLALTIDNSGNTVDVNVGLFASVMSSFTGCGEGTTTAIGGQTIVVTSNGIAKLVTLQKYAYRNPLKVVGMRVSFAASEQAGKTITYKYVDPFKSDNATVLQPESFRSERNAQDKIITMPVSFTLGDQTEVVIQVAASSKISFFIMFGGVYNTSKSLSRKHDRAAINLTPAQS